MAKRKRRQATVGGYFREVFAAHPEWLKIKSNAAVLGKYRADHGMASDAAVAKNIVANLANVKSVLRKKGRVKSGAKSISVTTVASAGKLEALEELIDECLTMAKNIDRSGLEHIINKLRTARNEVVWKLGK
ncbi:MAG: hypothetical protein L0Y71_06180 [Gemmataceae bacterium]|nr:hypothetical protein [Gemmataceae bacterium]